MPDAPDTTQAPAAPDAPVGVLAGAPQQQAPDLSGGTPTPNYTGGTGDSTVDQLNQQNFTPSTQPTDPARPWKGVLTAALAVLSGAAPGFGQKTFSGGVAAGSQSVQAQQQLKLQNDQKQQQLAMEEQRSMDEHQTAQANLATAHLTQQTLAAQYDLMPKTTQDIIDRQSMAAGETAKEQPGSKVVGTFGTYQEAQANQQAYMKANPDAALNTQLYHNTQGGFDVISVPNPEKLNDKPVDVTIGYDVKSGQPITKTYAAGTISYAQRANMETQAAQNAAAANNQLEQYKRQSAVDVQTAGDKAKATGEYQKNLAEAAKAKGDAGMGDVTLSGEDYIKTLPAGDGAMVRQIGSGQMELTPRMLQTASGQQLAKKVAVAYPGFDMSRAHAYFQTRQSFTSGKAAASMNNLNTALGHMGKLYDVTTASATLPGVSAVARAFGGSNAKAFEYYKDKVGQEIERVYQGGALTKDEYNDAKKQLSEWTPGNVRQGEKALTTLLVSKLEAYQTQWNNAKPSAAIPDYPVISPENVAVIKKITGEDIQMPNAQQSRNTLPVDKNNPANPEPQVQVQIPGHPAGSIPASKVAAFKQKYPTAVISQ